MQIAMEDESSDVGGDAHCMETSDLLFRLYYKTLLVSLLPRRRRRRQRDKNGASNSTRVKMEMPGVAENDWRARLSSSSPEREGGGRETFAEWQRVSLFVGLNQARGNRSDADAVDAGREERTPDMHAMR